jgi:hypothetical protein
MKGAPSGPFREAALAGREEISTKHRHLIAPSRFLVLWLMALLGWCCSAGPGTASEDNAHGHPIIDHRWPVNAETQAGIRRMQAVIAAYPANGLTGAELKDTLGAQLDGIFTNCTMEGEAHVALHDHLVPLMSLMSDLPDDPSAEQVEAIGAHLRTFDEEFR